MSYSIKEARLTAYLYRKQKVSLFLYTKINSTWNIKPFGKKYRRISSLLWQREAILSKIQKVESLNKSIDMFDYIKIKTFKK